MRTHNSYFKSELQSPDSGIWNLFSLFSILFCLAIFLIQWQLLPFFLDMYYHLAVAKGFEACGGIAGHNFWEYGPQGAAHLYPPLIHILILGFLKIGVGGITILKSLSCLMPVSLLLTLWYVIKNIFSKRLAFFAVFLGLCASLFTITASFTPAATLGIIILLFGLYYTYKKQTAPAILTFALLFYTHITIAIAALLFIMLSGLFGILSPKRALKILLTSLLIGAPWLLHIIKNLSEITWQNTAQMPIRAYPVISLFAIAGIIIAIKKIGYYRILFALLLSFLPMLIFYPFRFFCSQGMAGFLPFAALGLEKSYLLIDKNLRKRKVTEKYTASFLIVLLLYLLIFAPGIQTANGYFKTSDSLLTAMFESKERNREHILSSGIYNSSLIGRLSGYTKNHSEKGEFIWSNYRYIAGMLWFATERPTLSHMLLEIKPKKEPINIHNAALLIIIDEPRGEFEKIYKRVKVYFKLIGTEKEGQTDIYILRNENLHLSTGYTIHKPIVSMGFTFILLALYLFAILTSKK